MSQKLRSALFPYKMDHDAPSEVGRQEISHSPKLGVCVYFWLRPSLLHIHLQNKPVRPPVLTAGHRELTLRPQMQPEAGT